MSSALASTPEAEVERTTPDPAQILLVEDSDTHALLVEAHLKERPTAREDGFGQFVVTRVASLAEAHVALDDQTNEFHGVLLDLTLPDAQDLEALTSMLERTTLPIVVMTGSDDVDRAVAAMRLGAQDYLLKASTSPTAIARSLRFAIERVQMAADLVTAREMRDLAVTRLNDFLTLSAHEMLGPLTTVSGMGLTLTRNWDDVDPERRRSMVNSMTGMAGVVVTVSKQLLALAREREGDMPTPETVEAVLSDAIHDAALMSRVTVDFDPDSDVVVRVDRDHLRVILRNLFSNARKYGAEPIEISHRRDGESIVVTVRDHGPGIPPENLEKLFTRWAGSNIEGSHGLGLYLAHMLADANGGALTYVGDGDGAAFEIVLSAP